MDLRNEIGLTRIEAYFLNVRSGVSADPGIPSAEDPRDDLKGGPVTISQRSILPLLRS